MYPSHPTSSLNSRQALSNQMLEGFEMGSYQPRSSRARPHTVVETWDVPRVPVGLPTIDTHPSFATPTDLTSGDEASSRTRGLEAKSGSSEAFDFKMDIAK